VIQLAEKALLPYNAYSIISKGQLAHLYKDWEGKEMLHENLKEDLKVAQEERRKQIM